MPHQTDIPEETSVTAAILDHLALHGATPGPGEIDHRPLPQPDEVDLAMASLFDTTIGLLTGSQLEDNLEEMLWSLTSIFHRRLTHIQKLLDDNEFEVRESLAIQDGSEVASVELERLQMIGLKLWDHRDAFEQMRDLAVDHFSAATGSPWLPRTGSKVSHRGLTSAVVDSRAYLSAKRRKETEVHCPEGTRIAFSGGDYQAYDLIWSVLDATLAKYPDMVLLHGGTPKGAEMIAARWADRSATAISKRLFSDARSGPKAWRNSTLNSRRSASVSLDAPFTSISSAGFTISPMFGATSSVRLLLVLGRVDSDKGFPLAGDSPKAKIKPVSEARFCVSIQVAHKPPDS